MRPVRLVPLPVIFSLAFSLAFSLVLASCSKQEDASKPNIPPGSMTQRDGYTILWLHGTPYEMGYQHGTLLQDKLREAAEFLLEDPFFVLMRNAAKIANIDELAIANSYPWMLEECRGLVDAIDHPQFGFSECLLINFGDVAYEFIQFGVPINEDITPACSQVVASGEATPDGKLYHARILDWFAVDFVIDNPVLFVREPKDGIPHIFVGFPGNLSSYQGMNVHGIAVASNEVHPRDNTVNDLTGRSHVQMVVEILTNASTLEEAREIATSSNHMSLETLVVSDGKSGRAEVFELAPRHIDVRGLQNDVVFATNHFVGQNTSTLDRDPVGDSSMIRWERLSELVPPGSPESRHRTFGPEGLVSLMRDRINPRTGIESPVDEVDDGLSLATNGALYQLVFAPESLSLWVAAGKVPVPRQPFIGFNLGELLGMEDYQAPSTIP